MALRYQVASDVIRDGLGIELVDDNHDVWGEVFRHDTDHRATVTLYREGIELVELERLFAYARRRLGKFEDGTQLPT
jgi:hypothetical protein